MIRIAFATVIFLGISILSGCASGQANLDAQIQRAQELSTADRNLACSASAVQVETHCRGAGPFYPECRQTRQTLYVFCAEADKAIACQAALRDQAAQCKAMAVYNPLPPYCASANKAVSLLCY